jgi:hypothetical protein
MSVSDPLALFLCQIEAPLKVYSRTLGDLWLVPDGYDETQTDLLDAPTYSHDECRLLLAMQLDAEKLRAIHLAKKHFAGVLMMAVNPTSLRALYRQWLAAYRQEEERLRQGSGDENQLLQLARRLSFLEEKATELEEDE